MSNRVKPMYNFSMAGHIRWNREKPYLDLWYKGKRERIYSDKDGNPIYSEVHAHRLLERIRSEIDTGEFNPKNYRRRDLKALQMEGYALAWLERQGERLEGGEISHGYLRELFSAVHNHIIPKLGARDIRNFNKGNIDDFLRAIKATTKTKKNILTILKSIFLDAIDRQDLLKLPCKFPKIGKAETRIKILTPEAQDEILEQITDPVRKAFFFFLVRMGVRPGEARALRWDDIDWERKVVEIHAAMDLDFYRPSTKEEDYRVLPLDEDVLAVLEALPRTVPYVFSYKGKPFGKSRIGEWWRKAATEAGYNIPLYQATKHSLGCQARARGIPLDVIQEWFGHKNPESTKIYAKLQVEGKKVMHRPQTVRSIDEARKKSNKKK
jgi:integrase